MDATDQISQLFFVNDFFSTGNMADSDSQNNISQDDGDSEQELSVPHEKSKLSGNRALEGHLLLVETKKGEKRKAFRKLHLVQIQDQVGPAYLEKETKNKSSKKQSLSRVDQLTISETHSKFVHYDCNNGLVFLMNQERQRDRHLRLFSVKIKREQADDSDSDDDQRSAFKMRFVFITEVRLEIKSESHSAILKFSENPGVSSHPQAHDFKVIHIPGQEVLQDDLEQDE